FCARVWSSCSIRGVFVEPGKTLLTVMPNGASSVASVLDQLATAQRVVLETPRPAMGSFTEVEMMLTMRPNCAACMQGITISARTWLAMRCLRYASRNASTFAPCAGPGGGPPELLTRMCTGFAPTNFSATARKPSVSPESATMKSCFCESWVRGNSLASCSSASVRRARAVTFAPSCASSTAHARPMPCDAPHTNAWRPVRSRSISFSAQGLKKASELFSSFRRKPEPSDFAKGFGEGAGSRIPLCDSGMTGKNKDTLAILQRVLDLRQQPGARLWLSAQSIVHRTGVRGRHLAQVQRALGAMRDVETAAGDRGGGFDAGERGGRGHVHVAEAGRRLRPICRRGELLPRSG